MYAKEMGRSWIGREVDEDDDEDEGGGDKVNRVIKQQSQTSSDTERDEFTLSYGNYGNPYSFAPYQLILLLVDFIFNWAMDLVHEDPLAVLVIFIFQSLAIIINIILYIMASASQAMQVGLQRRVTIHHWLNLCLCLTYLILTGWWFIWALRKSWPSVSDQFSFTWPATDLEEISRSLSSQTSGNSTLIKNATMSAALKENGNATKKSPDSSPHSQIHEHYTLWSPGFNAVYVIHRIVAILYYFIYLKATFLVLNTPTMEKFVERKKRLVEWYEESKKQGRDDDDYDNRSSKGRRRLTSSRSFPAPSSVSLGVDEYLSGDVGFFLEGESKKKNKSGRKSNKRQILWADDDNGNLGGRNETTVEGRQEDDDENISEPDAYVKKKSSRASERKQKREKVNQTKGERRRTRKRVEEEDDGHRGNDLDEEEDGDGEVVQPERVRRGDSMDLQPRDVKRKVRKARPDKE